MAAGNIEIELRFPVVEASFYSLRENAKQDARFVKRMQQVDEYFTPPHRNFLEPERPFEWLRLGVRGGKAVLTYKHFFPENAAVTTHCDELECEVSDASALRQLLASLDFKLLVTVEKEREVYAHPEGFEVAFDEVKELGRFIEMEAAKDFGGVEAARAALSAFAKRMGLNPAGADLRGYPYLLLEKRGLLNKH